MKLFRSKMLLMSMLAFVFLFTPQYANSNECKYGSLFNVKPQNLLDIIVKYCESDWNPTYDTWIIEKLDLSTGIYETVGVLHNAPKWYPEAVSFPANIAILDNDGQGLSFDVISLSTMKVIGKITVDVQSSGEDLCQIQGESSSLISPDGTRVAIPYIPNEQKDCTQAIAIYDLKTYKLINTLYNISLGKFSSDGKFLYAYSTPPKFPLPIGRNLYLINTSTGKIVSQLDITTINVYPDLEKDYWIGRYAENGKIVKIFQLKDVNANGSPLFLYNMETKATTPTITTDWYCEEGKPGLPDLSPGAKWWIADNARHNHVDIYDVSTGNKVAGFNISDSTGKGAIISWANDHTFIYNTTQKLIYFDILKNKIIKELPIIRPWEKPGWKPEVGK